MVQDETDTTTYAEGTDYEIDYQAATPEAELNELLADLVDGLETAVWATVTQSGAPDSAASTALRTQDKCSAGRPRSRARVSVSALPPRRVAAIEKITVPSEFCTLSRVRSSYVSPSVSRSS